MTSLPMTNSCPAMKGGEATAFSALEALRLRGLGKSDVAALYQNSFLLYTCFLMGGSMVYHQLGGSFQDASIFDMFAYVSVILETFGLLGLRHKINCQNSVSGISGMTMGMYAVVYTIRAAMGFPAWDLDSWAVKSLEITSLLIVLAIVWSIFVTHRQTYQEDLDVLRMKHLIPGCLLLAVLLHPDLREGLGYDMIWTSCLYLDIMALMPQVIMMSRGGGLVQAPISHFVAATAFSRTVDLCFWYYAFDTVGPVRPAAGAYNKSGWLIVFFHVFHLCLVADFVYYYMKARLSGSSLSEDLYIPCDGDDII